MMSLNDPASIVSVTDRVTKVALGAPATAVHFLGDVAVFVSAEESVSLANGEGETTSVTIHGGGILCSAADGKRVIAGGDDGKLVAVDAKSQVETLATDAKRRWIDNVAIHPDGAVAWSAGKTAFVRAPKGDEKTFDMPSTVGGLAFAPKGLRLGVAHYNGVTLWFPNMSGKPEFLEWKGSHLGITFSADNRFLVTTMHEAALHGWRLADLAAHAHDGISIACAFDVMECRRKIPGYVRFGQRDPVAVREQGWADGQGAGDACAASGQGYRRRVSSQG